MFTRDFTFIEEGNANTVPLPTAATVGSTGEQDDSDVALVNYQKMELWGGLLLVLKKLQSQNCTIEGDLVIDNYLANFSPLTDNNLYNASSILLMEK